MHAPGGNKYLIISSYFFFLISISPFSSVQRRSQRKCGSGQVLQPLLAVPRRISTFAALPCDAGVRQTIPALRCPTHRRLRHSHHPDPPRYHWSGQLELESAEPSAKSEEAAVQDVTIAVIKETRAVDKIALHTFGNNIILRIEDVQIRHF